MTALHLAKPPQPEGGSAPPKRRRRVIWLLLIGCALGGAALAFTHLRERDPLAGVSLVDVKRGDIEDAVTALGKIQPRGYVDVGAQVSGQLQRIAVQPGELVKQGQLLAEIDPQLQLAKLEIDRAQLAQLEAERDVQKLQVELAAGLFQRQVRMKQDGATREDAYDRASTEQRMAAAKLAAIEAQIRQVRSTIKADEAQLGYTRIFAPMGGTVVSLDVRPGQTLIAAQQVPAVLRIADLTTMTVWAQVSEADIQRLQPGMALYFTTLGQGDRKWHGKLREVLPAPPRITPFATPGAAPGAPSNIVLYTALFDIDNRSGELRPEMSAQVSIVTAQAKDAVLVPVQALRDESPDGHEASVSVVSGGGKPETRRLKLGVRNPFDAQVLEGLHGGERVVKDTPSPDGAAQP